MAEAPRANPQGNTEFDQLRTELQTYGDASRYSDEFLKEYQQNKPDDYAALQRALDEHTSSPELDTALTQLDTALTAFSESPDRLVKELPSLMREFKRYYDKVFFEEHKNSYAGNMLDLYRQINANPRNPERLNAALAVFDSLYAEWLTSRWNAKTLKDGGEEYAKICLKVQLPQSFWDMFAVSYVGNLRELLIAFHNQSDPQRLETAGALLQDKAVEFLGAALLRNNDAAKARGDFDSTTWEARNAVVQQWMTADALSKLVDAYNEAFPAPVAEKPAEADKETVAATAATDGGASASGGARERAPEPSMEARKDAAREEAQEHPDQYMDGDKDRFTFKAEKGSDADKYVRIEDLYRTDADRALTLNSSRYAGLEFKYDAARDSFYEWDGTTFGAQRLAIRAGDLIQKKEETPPAVATATEPVRADGGAKTVDAAKDGPTTPTETPKTPEEDAASTLADLRAIRVQRQAAEQLTRALGGTTREQKPEEWAKVDAAYVEIARLYDALPTDPAQLKNLSPEDDTLVKEVLALKAQIPDRLNGVGAPDGLRATGSRVAAMELGKKDATDSRMADAAQSPDKKSS